jgi:hypothetical protein
LGGWGRKARVGSGRDRVRRKICTRDFRRAVRRRPARAGVTALRVAWRQRLDHAVQDAGEWGRLRQEHTGSPVGVAVCAGAARANTQRMHAIRRVSRCSAAARGLHAVVRQLHAVELLRGHGAGCAFVKLAERRGHRHTVCQRAAWWRSAPARAVGGLACGGATARAAHPGMLPSNHALAHTRLPRRSEAVAVRVFQARLRARGAKLQRAAALVPWGPHTPHALPIASVACRRAASGAARCATRIAARCATRIAAWCAARPFAAPHRPWIPPGTASCRSPAGCRSRCGPAGCAQKRCGTQEAPPGAPKRWSESAPSPRRLWPRTAPVAAAAAHRRTRSRNPAVARRVSLPRMTSTSTSPPWSGSPFQEAPAPCSREPLRPACLHSWLGRALGWLQECQARHAICAAHRTCVCAGAAQVLSEHAGRRRAAEMALEHRMVQRQRREGPAAVAAAACGLGGVRVAVAACRQRSALHKLRGALPLVPPPPLAAACRTANTPSLQAVARQHGAGSAARPAGRGLQPHTLTAMAHRTFAATHDSAV